MTIDDISKMVFTSEDYAFLKRDPLGDNVILIGLGGSYAYGTNTETSDIDIRGVATHSSEDILTRKGFEQVVNEATDTTVYSLEKIINLLSNCNPNVIELLGLQPWQYIYINSIGRKLVDNADMFLSKRAVHSFGGYASQQLWRIRNLSVRYVGQEEQERHVLESIKNAQYSYPGKYFSFPDDSIRLYLDNAIQDEYEKEIFMDIHLTHYPLRDYKSMWNDMKSIVKDYSKVGRRNKRAIDKDKLNKHMMHLVRLYLMCFDILENGEINTYRENDREYLSEIRNGKYLDDDKQPTKEFYEIISEYDNKLNHLKNHSVLPDNPDFDRINKFLMETNLKIVKDNDNRRG